MDEGLSSAVRKVFVFLYNEGLIYKGQTLVNWDTKFKTAISDLEVVPTDVSTQIYYIKYPSSNGETITVATVRPETIFGDVAICLNPLDKRSKKLRGMSVIVPILNKKIPIIFDDYVDPDFGTGCLKITPAHDVNDKLIGDKHNLEIIDVLNEDGTLNNFGLHYNGMDRFKVRTKIADELFDLNLLEKTEDYVTKVGFSERTNEIIEPKLSVQWFLKMDSISKPALDSVLNKEVNLFPKKIH
jgi:valyl-tRNA synthetase